MFGNNRLLGFLVLHAYPSPGRRGPHGTWRPGPWRPGPRDL